MLLSAALLASGCTMVGPDFVKPEVAVPEAWSDVEEAKAVTEATDYREWWKNVNDPTLDALIQMLAGRLLSALSHVPFFSGLSMNG